MAEVPLGPSRGPFYGLVRANKPTAAAAVGTTLSSTPFAKPTNPQQWLDLGFSIPAPARSTTGAATPTCVVESEPEPLTERACYIRALELGPNYYCAWFTLGQVLLATENEWSAVRHNAGTNPSAIAAAAGEDRLFASAVVGGVEYFVDDCLTKCMQTASDCGVSEMSHVEAACFALLAEYTDDHGRLVAFGDAKMSSLDCLQRAVAADPTHGPVALSLGRLAFHLRLEELRINNREFVGKHCFAQALNSNECATDPLAWVDAAQYLALLPRGEYEPAVNIGGTWKNALECFKQALQIDPDNTVALFNVAMRMPYADTVTLSDGVARTRTELLCRFVELSPTADNYLRLASEISETVTVTVNGEQLTKTDLLTTAYRKDPNATGVFQQLAMVLPVGGTFTVDGTTYNEIDLAVKAVEGDAENSAAWHALAVTMLARDAPKSAQVLGQTVAPFDAFATAIRLDPTDSLQSCTMIIRCVVPSQPFELNGLCTNSINLLAGVVTHNPSSAAAWQLLGQELLDSGGPSATVEIVMNDFTPKSCFIQALLRNADHAAAWLGLATSSGREDPIVINNGPQSFDRRVVMQKAILLSGEMNAWAWLHTGKFLENESFGEREILLGEDRSVDVRGCYRNAIKHSMELFVPVRPEALLLLASTMGHNDTQDIEIPRLSPAEALAKNGRLDFLGRLEPIADATPTQLLTLAAETMLNDFTDRDFCQAGGPPLWRRIWSTLADFMGDDDTATVNGVVFTKAECLEEAAE